jgi:hypothetical protein
MTIPTYLIFKFTEKFERKVNKLNEINIIKLDKFLENFRKIQKIII